MFWKKKKKKTIVTSIYFKIFCEWFYFTFSLGKGRLLLFHVEASESALVLPSQTGAD